MEVAGSALSVEAVLALVGVGPATGGGDLHLLCCCEGDKKCFILRMSNRSNLLGKIIIKRNFR